MRDCCLLKKIFATFYPEVEAVPLYTSGTMYRNPTREFMDYVSQLYIPGRTLILDFGGAFKSGRNLFTFLFNQLPRVHLLQFSSTRAPHYEGLTFLFRADDELALAGLNLEILNSDVMGSLVDVFERSRFDFDNDSSDERVAEVIRIRHPMKYRMEHVRVNHDAIDLFCATANSSLVRHLLRQVATEKTDGDDTLSMALLYDAMKEVPRVLSYLQLYLESDFLDQYTLKVAFDFTYRDSTIRNSSYCTTASEAGDCSRTGVVPWSWYPYVDILAAEWSVHGSVHTEQQERLLLLDHSEHSSFETTATALMLYWGPLLRRVDSLQLLGEEQPVLHSSWVTNSAEDLPQGSLSAVGEFRGPIQYDSIHSFAQTITRGSNGSDNTTKSSTTL
eukprot:gene1679-2268_t